MRELINHVQQVPVTRVRGSEVGPYAGLMLHRLSLSGEKSWDIQCSVMADGPTVIVNHGIPQPVSWDWVTRLEQLITDVSYDRPITSRLPSWTQRLKKHNLARRKP